MRFSSNVYVSYDYIKQLYKTCDDNNLEPTWLRELDKFIDLLKKTQPEYVFIKGLFLEDLMNMQCKSEKNKKVFQDYYAEMESKYVYDELLDSIIQKVYDVDNIAGENRYVFNERMTKVAGLLYESGKKHDAETLVNVFKDNRNVSKWANYGVKRDTLVKIFRLSSVVRNKQEFLENVFKSFKNILKKLETEEQYIIGDTAEITSESEKFKGFGSKEAFEHSKETKFGKKKLTVKKDDFYKAYENETFMEIFETSGFDSKAIENQLSNYLTKNFNEKQNFERVKAIFSKGIELKKDKEEVLITDKDVDELIKLPQSVLFDNYAIKSFLRTERNGEKHARLEELYDKYSKNETFMSILDKMENCEIFNKRGSGVIFKFNLNYYFNRNRKDPSKKKIIDEIIKKHIRNLEGSEYLSDEEIREGLYYPLQGNNDLYLTEKEVLYVLNLSDEILNNFRTFVNIKEGKLKTQTRENRELERKEKNLESLGIKDESEKKNNAQGHVEKIGESEISREMHFAMLNKEIKNLSKILNEVETIRRNNKRSNIFKREEAVYYFNELDFMLLNHHNIKSLLDVIEQKMSVTSLRGDMSRPKLARVQEFLYHVRQKSYSRNIVGKYQFTIDGVLRDPTEEEKAIAIDYLKQNNIAINDDTYYYAIRRLLVGGDINSKYDKDVLTIEFDKNIKKKSDDE